MSPHDTSYQMITGHKPEKPQLHDSYSGNIFRVLGCFTILGVLFAFASKSPDPIGNIERAALIFLFALAFFAVAQICDAVVTSGREAVRQTEHLRALRAELAAKQFVAPVVRAPAHADD